MTKRSKNERCVHCLGNFEDRQMTRDHVVPNAWYPSSVPQRDRPTVPSCLRCNQRLSKIERALSVRLGLCIDPNDPIAGEFARKAARAVNARIGSDAKDAAHRLGLRNLIVRNWMTTDEFSGASVIPGFEAATGGNESDLRAIGIAKADVDGFGEKLVRGASYLFSNLYVETGHEIAINLMRPNDNPFLEVLAKFGRCIEFAPGISIRRAGDIPEDPACGLFEFKFWGRLHIYGTVIRS